MDVEEEIKELRRHLYELARDPDDALFQRYELRRPPMPPGTYWRLRWLAGCLLRWLRSLPFLQPQTWPVNLKQSRHASAKALLLWGMGLDRETLRAACRRFSELQVAGQEFAPVLITDVADFAFYSRLGWLVEYVPHLAGEGTAYDERKLKFLARLYRGIPGLPVSIGLNADHSTLGRLVSRTKYSE